MSERRFVLIRSALWAAAVCGAGSWACGGGGPGSDGGADASRLDSGLVDAGRRDAASRDSGRPAVCDPACGSSEECCAGPDGRGVCVDPRSDVGNCGSCGNSCLPGKGTECVLGACVCGRVDFGCGGTDESICCPPTERRAMSYCANLRTDGDDCGACGRVCDVTRSNQCAEGLCVCGDLRGPCPGGATSTCCVDELGFATCVDTTSDVAHCGACGHRCAFGQRCLDGVCTVGGVSCASGCGDGEVCCRGTCCASVLCDRGACSGDAGIPDSGGADSGAADSGAVDSGAVDSGAVDARPVDSGAVGRVLHPGRGPAAVAKETRA